MTYVSRRARITVPRWPNEFDPEFLFRVGRRCDGRLKRHSSCHDLRAWINDNCIKNEYLLELMSDGEVVLRPPLQLYGRFIPVPLLFKLLQSSGSENGNVDWEKIVQETSPDRSSRRKERKASALEPAYGEKDKKRNDTGYSFEEKDKSKPTGVSYEGKDKSKPTGVSYEGKDKSKPTGVSYEGKDKSKPTGVSHEGEDKLKALGISHEGKDKSKGSRPTSPKEVLRESVRPASPKEVLRESVRPASPKEVLRESRPASPKEVLRGSAPTSPDEVLRGSRPTSPKEVLRGSRPTSPKEVLRASRSPYDYEMPWRAMDEDAGPETARDYPSYRATQKWDPFEKTEYHATGLASQVALVDHVCPPSSPMQSSIVMDEDYEKRKDKIMSHKSGSEGSLARVLLEKDMIEKNLFKSTCLLTKALGKLEKIDNIIQVADEEREKMRKGEIHEAFRKPTINCIYVQGKSNPEKTPSWGVKYRVRSLGEQERQDTLKCSELLRQISGLREKLKKNQECQQKVNEEITMSQREPGSATPPHVTDLNSEGETQMRRLQKKLEKLINHRGKLLSDMCQALTQLNNLKRSKNSRVDMRQRTRSGENRTSTFRQELYYCSCRNCQSSESERAHYSDSGSSSNNHFRRLYGNFNRNDDKSYNYYTSTDNLDSGQRNSKDPSHTKSNPLSETYASNGEFYKDNRQEKELRKSILRFCCPNPPCKQDTDLDASERYLPSGQRSPHRGASVSRPSTSPTTKREKRDASEEPRFASYGNNSQEVPERRVKSETTMKEIEKTLRNYEQRLNDMDGLEYKVEEWKRKLLEACKWKRNASKVETQLKREQENERNRASLEINGLFSQNYELKKQVRQLMDKSKEQAKKIQNMKSGILKARELESETEELKKELSEYRNSYEHQRKCISKWESVVALQRKEIENLMNHIRKLTTEKKEQVVCCQDKKYVQRTRSCSPVTLVDCQTYCRPESCNLRSDDENGSCCCQDFRQSDSRRSQLRFFDKGYYSSLNERDDWCT